MRIIYDIGLRVYYLLILLASPWNPKAAKWISGRKGWREQLEKAFSEGDKVIWFHCASLGEFEQGRPIIEMVRKEYPEYKILLSFFSPSGYEKRKNYDRVDHVCYLPLDTRRNARDFVSRVPLEKVFFIKYEFWYHTLRRINKAGIPLYLASGKFLKSHFFFRWYGSWYRKVFSYFTHIFVQDEESESLLAKNRISNVSVAGDTRFDRVVEISATHRRSDERALFPNSLPVIVAGSTWEKDEMLLKEVYYALEGSCNWIIAPHEPSAQNIARLTKFFPGAVLYSDILMGKEIMDDVLLVDTIGHLSSLYRKGNIAYIGGGFGKGIHNILEATAAGLPVFFGPKMQRFKEAVDLQTEGGAYVIQQVNDLHSGIRALVSNEKLLIRRSQIAVNYTHSNTGATRAIVNHVFKSIS